MNSPLPLFEPTIPPELAGARLAVASILLDRWRAVRRGAAVKRLVTSREIAARLGWPDSRAADVRHIVADLVDTHGLEIVPERDRDGGGYRIADSREEWLNGQMAGLRQMVTMAARLRRRLGEKGFRAALVRLKVIEALGLDDELKGVA